MIETDKIDNIENKQNQLYSTVCDFI